MGKKQTDGFTLVEIMIVVVIVGLLAAMALPAFQRSRMKAQNARLANDFRVFAAAAESYILETGEYPEDSGSGAVPAGLGEYIQSGKWAGDTPIGGVWDFEDNSSYPVTSAFGVDGYTVSEEQLALFDRDHDDNSLTTGKFRKIDGDRYYYVVVD